MSRAANITCGLLLAFLVGFEVRPAVDRAGAWHFPGVASGPLKLVMIHETADDGPDFARMEVAIRNGDPAAYLASKHHELVILDQDSKTPDNRPSPVVEALRPQFSAMKLPVLFGLDAASGRQTFKAAVPPDSSAADVLAIIKAHGG